MVVKVSWVRQFTLGLPQKVLYSSYNIININEFHTFKMLLGASVVANFATWPAPQVFNFKYGIVNIVVAIVGRHTKAWYRIAP